MGQPRKSYEIPLKPQIVLEHFEKRAINFVGPFNPPSNQKVHILFYTNYVTKWVEARAVVKAIEKVVANFVFEQMFARYGTPSEITSNRGA